MKWAYITLIILNAICLVINICRCRLEVALMNIIAIVMCSRAMYFRDNY